MFPEMLARLRLRNPHQPPRHTYEEMFAESGLRVFHRALAETRRRSQFYLSLAHLLNALVIEDAIWLEASLLRVGLNFERARGYINEAVAAYPVRPLQSVQVAPDANDFLRKVKEIARAGNRRIEAADFFAALEGGELRFPRKVEWKAAAV